MTFTPASVLPPNKEGRIDITIPYWYYITNDQRGDKFDYMYNEDARDKCSSDQLTISSSQFTQGNLQMFFSDINSAYVSGSPIELRCLGFKNPIYPDVWSGFRIFVYDN